MSHEARLELHTERVGVKLRQFRPGDAEQIFAAIDYDRQHFLDTGEVTGIIYPTLQSVRKSIVTPNNPSRLRMGIWDKDTIVGSINLTAISEGESIAEIGYWVGAEHVRRGYASLAMLAMTGYGLEKYRSIVAIIHDDNVGSRRVAEKAGYLRLENRPRLRQNYSTYAVGELATKN